jgi:hypothetical protein
MREGRHTVPALPCQTPLGDGGVSLRGMVMVVTSYVYWAPESASSKGWPGLAR